MKDDLSFQDRGRWIETYSPVLQKLQNSYWLAHGLLGSRAKVFYGDVYDLPSALGEFDVVLFGQILVHLSDPVRALASAAKLSKARIVITEGMFEDDRPLMQFISDHRRPDPWAWWHCSTGFYRSVLRLMGFEIERVERGMYRVMVPGFPEYGELKTIVARRVG